LDFVDDQVRIHWVLSYFKGGCTASFAERILCQELQSGKMCFASWREFTEEFASTFCPENEATTALMQLESDWYFQAKWNVEAYIDEFKDLIDLSGDTPQAPSPSVDRSWPKLSDAYRSSYIECRCDDTSHKQSQRQNPLHSYASNSSNAWRSQSVLSIIVYTLISYDTTYL
jgi:hypothetical protein